MKAGEGPVRDVTYDLTKLFLQGGVTLFVGIAVLVVGAFITTRLKRQTDIADECIEHLDETVSKAHDALRKLSRDAKAHVEADASAEARRKLGVLVTTRFPNASNYKRIVRLIGDLTVALDPADPMGRGKMTKARIGEMEQLKSRIDIGHGLCRAAIVQAARTNWTYKIWGKHN